MAFLQEEFRNFSFKGWNGILGTRNRSSAPDNGTYYEEFTTNNISVDPTAVLLELDQIPPASDMSEAVTNATNFPNIIKSFDGSSTANSIHLTPAPGNKAFFACTVYGDLSTRMKNFIMPQSIPKSDGLASIGYTIRLYQGDPSNGGTEITTTKDQVGADVGWFPSYGAGAIIVASSFTGISDPDDLWITGFQYIGKTALGSSNDISVDDITINVMSPGYSEKSSTGNNRHDVIDTYWMHNIPVGDDVGWRGCVTKDGAMQVQPGQNNLAVWNDSEPQDVVWDSGTYEFYSTIDITSLTPQLEDDSGNSYNFSFVGKDGIFFRYSVSIPVCKILYFSTMSDTDIPYTIYLINRYNNVQEDEISIKNIDAIIDGNNISIDGSFTDADNPHRELVTRNFVESRIPEADKITIDSNIKKIQTSTVTDYQELINDAWLGTTTTTGWSIGSNTSFSAGEFTIPLSPSENENVLTHNTAIISEAQRIVLITNFDMNNGNIFFYDDDAGLYSFYYKSGITVDNEYYYIYSIPAGWTQTRLTVSLYNSATDDFTFKIKLAVMEEFPPKAVFTINEINYIIDDDYKSIDYTNTGMVDPHKELVTRAYVDTKPAAYSMLFTQSDLDSGYLTVVHKLRAKNLIIDVSIRDNKNKILEPDDIEILDKNTAKIDFRTIEPIDDTWAIFITCLQDDIQVNAGQRYINGSYINSNSIN